MSTFCETSRPDIDYPCHWEYRVIGESEADIRAAIAVVIGGREHTVAPSRASAGGRYLSFAVEVFVADEAERLSVFAALRDQVHIRYVL
jgi:putative lipoic acid-binding regulatory protein